MGPEEDRRRGAWLGGDLAAIGGRRGAGDRGLGEMHHVRGSSDAIHLGRLGVEACEEASLGGTGGSEGRATGASDDPGLARFVERVA